MIDDDDRELLRDMRRQAEAARAFLGSAEAEDLAADEGKAFILLHTLQIIGEAANHVSLPTRQSIAEVPWLDIISLRHRIVHDYRNIRYEIIVKTIRHSVPELIDVLKRVLRDQDQ